MKFVFDEFKEGMGIAFAAIRANKMRSVLTTLGIVIGIVSVTLMGTAIEGLNRAFNKSIAMLGTVRVRREDYPPSSHKRISILALLHFLPAAQKKYMHGLLSKA